MYPNTVLTIDDSAAFHSVIVFNNNVDINVTLGAFILDQLSKKPLVILRNLQLSRKDLLRIGSFIGHPGLNKSTIQFDKDNPYLTYIESKQHIPPFFWHHDGFYLVEESLVKCVLFYCEKNQKGDARTLFVNTQDVYANLSEDEKSFLESKQASYYSFDNKTLFEHDLVKASAFNGKKSLFLNAVNLNKIDGFDDHDRSEQFMMSYLEKIVTEEGVYPHQWQVGDLVLMDNIAVMHAADDTEDIERLICRLVIH
jgi:alpha-ketoglutarate-dependent taurine dioxygenase